MLHVYAPASSVQYATIEFVIVEIFFVSVHIGIILAYLLTIPLSPATLKTSLANSTGTMYHHSASVHSFKYVAFRLKYIEAGPIAAPELATEQAFNEIIHFAKISRNGLGYVREAINESDPDRFEELRGKLVKYEEISEITDTSVGAAV